MPLFQNSSRIKLIIKDTIDTENNNNYNVKDIQNMINTTPAYNKEDEINYLIKIYEFIFGFYLRDDQFKLIEQLKNEILQGNYTNVYQMLMGKGKTSVISPILTLLFISNPQFNSIVHVMPTHIIKQSYSGMVKFIGNMFDVDILNIKYDRDLFSIDEMKRQNSNINS